MTPTSAAAGARVGRPAACNDRGPAQQRDRACVACFTEAACGLTCRRSRERGVENRLAETHDRSYSHAKGNSGMPNEIQP